MSLQAAKQRLRAGKDEAKRALLGLMHDAREHVAACAPILVSSPARAAALAEDAAPEPRAKEEKEGESDRREHPAISLTEGQQVVRGPDWQWGQQDGYAGDHRAATGLVLHVKRTGWCTVRWASGAQVLSCTPPRCKSQPNHKQRGCRPGRGWPCLCVSTPALLLTMPVFVQHNPRSPQETYRTGADGGKYDVVPYDAAEWLAAHPAPPEPEPAQVSPGLQAAACLRPAGVSACTHVRNFELDYLPLPLTRALHDRRDRRQQRAPSRLALALRAAVASSPRARRAPRWGS